jgi:V/A-type H+-transporting ATPase subunit D
MVRKAEVTRPTKIELARLKRRLKLATRIQKIIKDRLSILIMEFFQTVRECTSVKEKLLAELYGAYRALSLTVGYHGSVPLEKELLISEVTMTVYGGTRNVGGVWVPLFEIETSPTRQKMTNPTDTSSLIDHTTQLSRKLLERIVELAELQRSLELLGLEINKVKRSSNALEHVLIPGLEATIKYLAMKFEEREREEVARLKRVKSLIEQREAYAH